MTPAELAAYIGAAAWVPQISSWIYSGWAKPQIRISSAPTVEIGYTPFGPIVNLTAALSVERRDALIERVSLTSQHERGAARKFTWTSLNEVGQQQIQLPVGGAMDVVKNQPAIAMKVSTLTLIEKKICFQDTHDFQKRYRELEVQVQDQFMQRRDQPGAEDTTLASKEFLELGRFFSDNIYWQEGQYSFAIEIHEVRLSKPYIERFSVCLSRTQIDDVRRNLVRLQDYYRQDWARLVGKQSKVIYFNWVYPQIRKIQG